MSPPDTASVIVQQLTPPTAVITITPATSAPNQSFVADGSGSVAAAGSAVSRYRWTVGDQAEIETAGPRLTSAPTVGKLTITLRVVDDSGNVSAPAVGTVTVIQRH